MDKPDDNTTWAVAIIVSFILGYAAGRSSVQGGSEPSGDYEAEMLGG